MKIPYNWDKFVEYIEAQKDFIKRNPSIEGGNIVFDTGVDGKHCFWSYEPPDEISIGTTKYRKVEE